MRITGTKVNPNDGFVKSSNSSGRGKIQPFDENKPLILEDDHGLESTGVLKSSQTQRVQDKAKSLRMSQVIARKKTDELDTKIKEIGKSISGHDNMQ